MDGPSVSDLLEAWRIAERRLESVSDQTDIDQLRVEVERVREAYRVAFDRAAADDEIRPLQWRP
jgi:hypothetical protein